ncbi:Glycosaminoglycan xylosylkinase [Holothuria leucospilota]|uniref:Glycosaminoglycan xylosylkinase n=1 Tax=Holothuria leucospilota TaxID=206669 RepID=A0A9Q1H2E5_HOLLE|nr:Glycosaminoglycan xylosylkinase [Holothuria leucospilota]
MLRKVPSWDHFRHGITLDEMYPRSARYIPELLHDLSTERIVNVSIFKGGTQIKFLLKFADGNQAIAKPKRHPRDFYWGYNKSHPFWYDDERHTAEIASFHLDRILDYRRVPPCVGRKVNFSTEILQNSDDSAIYSTLRKQNGNTCFIGNCVKWCCNEDHPVCDENGGVMELSVCQMIPWPIHDIENYWSQGIRESKVWKNKNVCTDFLNDTKILKGRFFLDVIENSLFDHLIVNYDRHHIAKLGFIDKHRSFAAIIDNGKGFGNPFKDDITFLAPVYQCCRFRNSTYQHILSLTKEGHKLGDLMKSSLANDPLAPLLTDEFFPAFDRRLAQFIEVMDKCIERLGPETVLVDGLELIK